MARGYRQGVYDFVIDSSFTPFTMQEMLVPFTAYKDAYEKMEESYFDLSDKADKFKYLSETLPEGSKARGIYEGYANDLKAQADDLAKNGLGMGNRRALNSLKRRYSGEIGRLVEADAALKKEQELRRQMNAKDASMLYADDNLTIDRFLDNNTPNLYSISGNDLYTRGAAAGQAASKRVYGAEDAGSTLGGYYRDYVQRLGYNADTIAKFRQDMSTIPELQQAADDILKAQGVTGNLTGRNLEQARQQVINGMIDGAVYSENHNPTRDLGKLTQSEQTSFNLQRENMNRQAAMRGLFWNKKTDSWDYDANKDPQKKMNAYSVTNSGNPVYLDEKNRPFALGADGKTKYYDNDKDGNYTDRNPFVKPPKAPKQVDEQEALQRTGGLGIMAIRKGGSWQAATTDKEYEDAGTYIPIFDNIWGTRSKLVDWGGDWNLTSKASGKYRYIGDTSKLPLEAIQSITEQLPKGAKLKDYDVYGVLSRNSRKLKDSEKYDYVLWPKGQPFPYNQAEPVKQSQNVAVTPAVSSSAEEDVEPE